MYKIWNKECRKAFSVKGWIAINFQPLFLSSSTNIYEKNTFQNSEVLKEHIFLLSLTYRENFFKYHPVKF